MNKVSMVQGDRPALKAATVSATSSKLALTLLGVAIVLHGFVLSALSMARYSSYRAGMFDLGNMAQAIDSVLRGAPLVYTGPQGNVSRLAGHVELIYLGLAPLFWLWHDPRVLLVAQAVLASSAAVPVYRIAARRLPATSSVWFAIGYLLYPTAVAAVLFDLHGDTLAMPLLLWMLDALDNRAWRRFGLFLILSLLCKFYIAAPIFVLGCTLFTARTAPFGLADHPQRRRIGAIICGTAAVYGALMLLVVRPAFAPAYSDAATYVKYYFGASTSLDLAAILDRLINLLAVLLPSALLFWWAPWTVLPGFALIVPSLLSTGPGDAYAWSYHHYAAAAPFIVVGAIDGATRRVTRISSPRLRQREARLVGLMFGGVSLLFHVGLNDTPLGVPFWRSLSDQPSSYIRTERDAFKDRWLAANVPAQVALAASNFLAPHLWDRSTLYLVRYPDEPRSVLFETNRERVDVAIADALFDYYEVLGNGYAGGLAYDLDAIRQLLRDPRWMLTAARDGLLRFDRRSDPASGLAQEIRAVSDRSPATARFGDAIELVQNTIEPVGERRFRATFRWRATRDFRADEQFVAVSRLDGVANARMIHLPSYALAPTTTWRAGQVWEEQFEVEIPADVAAGRYTWRTGWYDALSPYAATTDARSRLGDEVVITTLDVR